MRVALGLKAHSGWAVLVAIGVERGETRVLDRRRIELIENPNAEWAGQPYHAATGKSLVEADASVQRGIAEARRVALRELRAAVKRIRDAGHEACACAVLVGQPMPDWSTAQILAVHLRMHQAEGQLYPDALARAAETCGLALVRIRAKELPALAAARLRLAPGALTKRITQLGKSVGAPWAADQKSAALAAMSALAGSGKPGANGVQ